MCGRYQFSAEQADEILQIIQEIEQKHGKNAWTPGEIRPTAKAPVLVAGGSGLSPLVGLARRLAEAGCAPKVLLGFREERERFGAELFEGVAAEVRYAADVLGALEETEHDTVYACGSPAMMEEAQLAFDVRMGCGFGACMGCAIRTRDGMKRVCTDGPVFEKWEMINGQCSMRNGKLGNVN